MTNFSKINSCVKQNINGKLVFITNEFLRANSQKKAQRAFQKTIFSLTFFPSCLKCNIKEDDVKSIGVGTRRTAGRSMVCTQRNLFEKLLNQTEIRLYLPYSD